MLTKFATNLTLALALFQACPTGLRAEQTLQDVPSSKDHPLVTRYTGSTLVAYAELPFDQTVLPLSNLIKDRSFVSSESIEGRITRLSYLAPSGKGVLEVSRNYEDALTKAGLIKRFSCARNTCGSSRIQAPFIEYAKGMKQVESYGGYSSLATIVLNTSEDPNYFWGIIKLHGANTYVSVFTSKIVASTDSPLNGRAATFIEIIEPKQMETGQVSVDMNLMRKGIAADGKIALYGVFFDTGKYTVKPESKPQLDEMAKLLTTDKDLKVFVVGHSDNQGKIEANLLLSQQRAEAISAVLVKTYGVDASRLKAKGIANYSPVSTNDDEAGRARNRRVELVKQ